MEEGLFSWLFLLITFVVIFRFLSRRKPTTSTLLRFIAVAICLTANAVFSVAVHWLVMSTGKIDTSGFLNINELLVFSVCWTLVALVALIITRIMAHQLQGIYKTVLVTHSILVVLPLTFFFVLFVLALVG